MLYVKSKDDKKKKKSSNKNKKTSSSIYNETGFGLKDQESINLNFAFNQDINTDQDINKETDFSTYEYMIENNKDRDRDVSIKQDNTGTIYDKRYEAKGKSYFEPKFIPPKQPEIRSDNRTVIERELSKEYTENVLNPNLKTQAGEFLQRPLRYMADPFKMIGDYSSFLNEDTSIPTTQEDYLRSRMIQANPNISNKEKILSSISEGASLANWAFTNVAPMEIAAGNALKQGKHFINNANKGFVNVGKSAKKSINQNLKRLNDITFGYNKIDKRIRRLKFLDGELSYLHTRRLCNINLQLKKPRECGLDRNFISAIKNEKNYLKVNNKGEIIYEPHTKYNGMGVKASGKYTDIQTGKTYETSFDFGTDDKIMLTLDELSTVKKTKLEGTGKRASVSKDDHLINILNKNKQHVENISDGKVIGSSIGVSEGGMKHVSGDVDVLISQKNYNKNIANKFPKTQDKKIAIEHNINPKIGDPGKVDFVIINETKTGKATGEAAMQLFRQFDPDGYYKAAKDAIKHNKSIKIPYTPDELINKTDPLIKTIMDSIESTKPKHMLRFDHYMHYGNTNKVLEAQNQYIKSVVGTKGKLAPKFDYTDIERNKRILNQMNFHGDKHIIAKNPKRMEIAMNDYYIHNTTFSRGVDQHQMKKSGNPLIDEIEASFKYIDYEKSTGGKIMGGGLNMVKLGDSGFGPVYGHTQLSLKLNTSSPEKFIESMSKQIDGNIPFTKDELKIVDDIYKKNQIMGSPKKPMDVTDQIARHPKQQEILDDITEKTGIRVISHSNFGNSEFASLAGRINNELDEFVYALKSDQSLAPKSLKQRIEAMRSAEQYNTTKIIRNKTDFYKVRDAVENGIEKIEKRVNNLEINDGAIYPNTEPYVRARIQREASELLEYQRKLKKARLALAIFSSSLTMTGMLSKVKKSIDEYNEIREMREENLERKSEWKNVE